MLMQNAWSWAACVFWRRAKANPHCILLSEALFFYQIELLAARTKKCAPGIKWTMTTLHGSLLPAQ